MRTALIAAAAAVAATYGLTSLAAATYSPAPAPSPSSAPDPEDDDRPVPWYRRLTARGPGPALPDPEPTEVPPPDPTDHWRANPNSSSGPPGNLPGARPGTGGPITGKKPWTLVDLRWMDREFRYWYEHLEWGEDFDPTGRPNSFSRAIDAIEAGNPPDGWHDPDCWAGLDELARSNC